MLTMDDQEQQCEDALFELCDARERYPLRCANELQKSIKLQNDINMPKVFQKSTFIDSPSLTDIVKQKEHASVIFNEYNELCFDHLDYKLQNMIIKLDNLKAVLAQIEKEQKCPTNKLLEG